MPTRDELKALIDRLPYEKLDLADFNLESILHPPISNPRIEQFRQRSEEFQKTVTRTTQAIGGAKRPWCHPRFWHVWGDRELGFGAARSVRSICTPGKRIVRT